MRPNISTFVGLLTALLAACYVLQSESVVVDDVQPHARVQASAGKQLNLGPPEIPKGFGDFVTVGDKIFINFSDEHTSDMVPIMELPKRMHENARKKHRYSKRDAEQQSKAAVSSKHSPPESLSSSKQRRLSFIPALSLTASTFSSGANVCSLASRCVPPPPAGGRARLSSLWMLPGRRPCPPSSLALAASGGGGLGFGGSEENKKKKQGGGGGLGFGGGGDGDRKGRGQSGLSKGREEGLKGLAEVEMHFTCNKCETRQSKRFTRLAYEEGVVIVKCKGCGVHHMIADNQGYFQDWTGKFSTNVEEMLAEKGEKVDNRLSKLRQREDGTLELAQPPETPGDGS